MDFKLKEAMEHLVKLAENLGLDNKDPYVVKPDYLDVKFPELKKTPSRHHWAYDLITVQPMSIPKGGIFYMDYKYGGRYGGKPNKKIYVCA